MPDETEANQPPQDQQPSQPGGAYSQGEKISKINVAEEIKKASLATHADANVVVELRSEIRQLQRQIINLEASADAHRKHLGKLETKVSALRRGE